MIRWACGAYKERFTKQSCSFWSIYALNLLSAGASPRPHWKLRALPHADPLASLGGGAAQGRGTRRGGGREGEWRGK